MTELWQLYNEQGNPLDGQGATKDDVFAKGLLHGASHVWIWRESRGSLEVLVQKRAANKRTWPNRYDISAAGHIDLGEAPVITAMREAKEEIDITINQADLKLISVYRAYIKANNGAIENEFQWLYLLKLTGSVEFNLQKSELTSLEWKNLKTFETETQTSNKEYVPHGTLYYEIVTSAIKTKSTTKLH